ncbi:ArdC family protein [Kordiimonas sp.]|uniref:ArdC family protein n=1 Tax=Kordiimonas sp. TaxID=1970157 RepID=UPI003A8CE2AC
MPVATKKRTARKSTTRKASTKPRVDAYQIITDKILALLDRGVVPWRKPWKGGGSNQQPISLTTGKAYRGINTVILWGTAIEMGYEAPFWLTYNQAKTLGGNVKKGENGTPVTFWKIGETKEIDEKTGKPGTYAILRTYTVFNVAQCENLDESKLPEAAKVDVELTDHDAIESCEAIVSDWAGKPEVVTEGGRAFYRRSTDVVTMPEIGRFDAAEEYYSALFHELIHSTGHVTRLDRLEDGSSFGSASYSKEELVAEMGAAFLCGHAGIESATIENSASYIDGWRKVLKADNKAVIQAASAAQKAVDMVLGVSWE